MSWLINYISEKMSQSEHELSNSTPLTEKDSADVENQHPRVRDYRKLAICSIICGLSCCGIMSLIYSIKTREINKRPRVDKMQKAKEYSDKAVKWGVAAIVTLLALIILLPLSLGLLSYLFTFIN